MKYVFLTLIYTLMSVLVSTAQDDITVHQIPHAQSTCSGAFVEHEIDHLTNVNDLPVHMFDSNGSGLAINDLNNDGLLDIVFANLDGEESIFWNHGEMQFRSAALDIPGRTRAVAILDLDTDGWNDILFTSQRAAPSWWRNMGNETFVFADLRGVSRPAYAMNWADLDNDGDLDLVTGTYDSEMERIDASYLLNGGAGVYYYENHDEQFLPTRLTERSQALAIYFPDVNGDGRWDIAIGNDFAELDTYWIREDNLWVGTYPFDVITHSTMSFTSADIQNDGSIELYATDMHPYSQDEATMAAWQPVMEDMMSMPMTEDDPQKMANVLQSYEGDSYINVSENLGIQYTGWSWSAKFGDLNSDGYLDLYVVNGMIAEELFSHLPNNELVEENQAFRNVHGQLFESVPHWNLNATESGRGMSMADIDGDGDLDIVVNNLMSNAQIFENQLCGGSNLTVTLQQPLTDNLDAIGATVVLHTTTGIYQREVRVASGYLSGDPTQLHIGFPDESTIEFLEIIWPDSTITRLDSVQVNTHLVITRQ